MVVPQEKKAVRRRLYSASGWAGFGNPTPGPWTSPHVDRFDETRGIIEDLDLTGSTIVAIGRLASAGLAVPQIIARGWRLDEVAERYAKLLDTYQVMASTGRRSVAQLPCIS
ncbi:hypothetical protein [Pseudonocardia spinosispora]|uniref:hypothetical protein n=1 Tax=Pseudonocardia spinosispora TaxID=103441 RepID=UPI0004185629|nr:hypothetical protein [Pseudonocardia spinosispora]